MRYYDQYQELYHSDDEWYYMYVDEQLKRIRRQYYEDKVRKRKNQR